MTMCMWYGMVYATIMVCMSRATQPHDNPFFFCAGAAADGRFVSGIPNVSQANTSATRAASHFSFTNHTTTGTIWYHTSTIHTIPPLLKPYLSQYTQYPAVKHNEIYDRHNTPYFQCLRKFQRLGVCKPDKQGTTMAVLVEENYHRYHFHDGGRYHQQG